MSALVIVRVFRGVARHRWTFDRHAVLADGELQMRFASNCPSMVLGLTINAQAVMKPWRYEPLALTNGGALSAISDVAARPRVPRPRRASRALDREREGPSIGTTLRHTIDAASPFREPGWRADVAGVWINVQGYDELLCEDVAVAEFIPVDRIVEGATFADVISSFSGPCLDGTRRRAGDGRADPQAVTFDYARLHRLDP